MKLKICIASDHAGISLKKDLIQSLPDYGWKDFGPSTADSVDYPDYADLACKHLEIKSQEKAILICGSGQGMAMRANKYPHIRAALCYSTDVAELSRKHNDANVLCLGARFVSTPKAIEIVRIFLETNFEGGRHQQRVAKLSKPVNN